MKVVADIGDVSYYENRALEAIGMARQVVTPIEAVCQIRQAVGLLLLSLVKREIQCPATTSLQSSSVLSSSPLS